MHQVFLLLGSNQGNRAEYLQKAIEALGKYGVVTSRSALYETEAWGKADQPAFLNQAISMETDLSPEALLSAILTTEEHLGRKRLERYGPRTIDIDILLYDELVHQSQTLVVPHPELPNRRFALTALADIASERIHPVLNQTIRTLFERCNDPLQVKRID